MPRRTSKPCLGLVGDRDPLDILRATPTALERAVAGLSLDQMQRPERPGKWSIAAVLQHLADSDVVWAWRMRLILAQDRPPITGYDQDLWADRLRYARRRSGRGARDVPRAAARRISRLLERATPEDLARVGVHAERGEESLGHLRNLYAGHDLLHLNQIARVRAAVV